MLGLTTDHRVSLAFMSLSQNQCLDSAWERDVFPSTRYLAMALEAATDGHTAGDIECYEVRDISFSKALIVLEDDHGIETLFTLRPASLNSISCH